MKDATNRHRKSILAVEAESLFQPYLDDVAQIHRAALDFWLAAVQANPKLSLDDTRNQARARVISNSIQAGVRKKFAEDEDKDVKLLDDSGFLVMVIRDKVAIRFKKLSKGLLPSNVMTDQQFSFSTQTLLKGFPPEATHLTFGHKLNSTGTEIEGFWLQCPRGNSNLWSIPLDKPSDLPLFEAESEAAYEVVAPPVVRAKSTKKAAR